MMVNKKRFIFEFRLIFFLNIHTIIVISMYAKYFELHYTNIHIYKTIHAVTLLIIILVKNSLIVFQCVFLMAINSITCLFHLITVSYIQNQHAMALYYTIRIQIAYQTLTPIYALRAQR